MVVVVVVVRPDRKAMTVSGRKAHRFKIKSHYASSGTC
jgi:hypothetical protein